MKKSLLMLCLILAAPFARAGDAPAPAAAPVKGEVLEVKEVPSYTYLRIKTREGETWAAVSKAPISKGAQVTIENPMVMQNFESKSLNRTFPSIVFGNLAGTPAPGAVASLPTGHAGLPTKLADVADIHVAKATGQNARTVAEIVGKGSELKDKPVVVRGKIVKYNSGIMGKNWIHLRDGTGTAATNDILVTTTAPAKLGDVVLVKGTVRTDKDFGSGYAYKVMIEDATLQP